MSLPAIAGFRQRLPGGGNVPAFNDAVDAISLAPVGAKDAVVGRRVGRRAAESAVAYNFESRRSDQFPSPGKSTNGGNGMARSKVLFLCTGNSCRSQMAEGWARALLGNVIEPYSAGIEAHGLNPNAVAVMAEAGIDISGQSSKVVDALAEVPIDLVVTVCGDADARCPAFAGKARVVHAGFDDPPKLARTAANAEEALTHYRRVRDEIREFVETKLQTLL